MTHRRLVIACLSVSAVGLVLYWVGFALEVVQIESGEVYRTYELTFPPADLCLAVGCAWAAVLLVRRSSAAGYAATLAAGGLLFLGMLDLTFNVQRGYFAGPPTAQVVAEMLIVAWCLTVGVYVAATCTHYRSGFPDAG